MNSIDSLLKCLYFEGKTAIEYENFSEYLMSFERSVNEKFIIDKNKFVDAIEFINNRDNAVISLLLDNSDPIQYDSNNGNIDQFISEIIDFSKFHNEDEQINLVCTLKIYKNVNNDKISIYNLTFFENFLESLKLSVLLNEFVKVNPKYNFFCFDLICDDSYLSTDMFLISNSCDDNKVAMSNRAQVLSNTKSSCHFNQIAKHNYIPDDFKVINSTNKALENFFNKLCVIFSIGYLYDILTLNAIDSIEYRLNGYKTLKGIIDLSNLNIDINNQYFQIYKWVYGNGTFTDKIGLARNIISLHLEGDNNVNIKGDPILAIQSSYKVYEKQNIKQYIEIRNKISDQLLGFHDRANKIVEGFASGFQKSCLALITFYISAILIRIMKNDNLVDVFTIDAAILSTVFICCSLGYVFVLRWEVNVQQDRFKRHYNDIKVRYKDLLDDQDVNRILNNDREFNQDVVFMTSKVCWFTTLWFVILFLLLTATWGIYSIYNFSF